MKILDARLYEKIRECIKNKQDISDLIKDVDIRNSNLSYAIIKTFNRICDNIGNCNFSYAIIGEDNKVTNLSGTFMQHCNFSGARFLGKVVLKKVDARYVNFGSCFIPHVEYQHGDFRYAKFCSMTMTIGSREGVGAKFSKGFLKELIKYWQIEDVSEIKEKCDDTNGVEKEARPSYVI